MPGRLVLLDFDGTLAYREGLWSGCALEVLDQDRPGHGVDIERFREGMQGAYPWNRHEEPHPELGDAEVWWEAMEERLSSAFERAGVTDGAPTLARALRERFVDHRIGWSLFDDAVPALEALRAGGWRTAVLSNHVPELSDLVGGLGLAPLLDDVFSSALIGFEKPHPEVFAHALRASGSPEEVWMVGDNPKADVAGAEAAGIPAVLVRGDGPAAIRADGLLDAVALITR